jgi:hypothetical protein
VGAVVENVRSRVLGAEEVLLEREIEERIGALGYVDHWRDCICGKGASKRKGGAAAADNAMRQDGHVGSEFEGVI